MFNYRFDVILSHKKLTWTDFGRTYIPYILPVATLRTHCQFVVQRTTS